MSSLDDLHGVALLQSGSENVVDVIGSTTGDGTATRCTRETRFQLASVSKQFTAAAVLLLADCGELSVADGITRWFDNCPAGWEAITVHHLLTHTSGLVHWRDVPARDPRGPMGADEELAIFREAPVLSSPGERFSYSSPGYVLLAHIVERVASQPYASFLEERIFGPLGMTSTFAGNGIGEANLARGHAGGREVPSFELDIVGMGAGDIWSTAGDVARWDRALASGALLSDAARSDMFMVHTDANHPLSENGVLGIDGYGYGWYIGRAVGARRVLFHPGDNPGFLAFNAWFPDQNLRVVVLTNEEATDLASIIRQLLVRAGEIA